MFHQHGTRIGLSDSTLHTALHPTTSACDAPLRPAWHTNHLLALGREVNESCLASLASDLASDLNVLRSDCVRPVDTFRMEMSTYSVSYTTLAS